MTYMEFVECLAVCCLRVSFAAHEFQRSPAQCSALLNVKWIQRSRTFEVTSLEPLFVTFYGSN